MPLLFIQRHQVEVKMLSIKVFELLPQLYFVFSVSKDMLTHLTKMMVMVYILTSECRHICI